MMHLFMAYLLDFKKVEMGHSYTLVPLCWDLGSHIVVDQNLLLFFGHKAICPYTP